MWHQQGLILKLHEAGAIKFGHSSDVNSTRLIHPPLSIDLKRVISHPSLLQQVSEAIWHKVQPYTFDLICGIPYTALTIATAISLEHQIPMVLRRKDIKEHSTKKKIEGDYQEGQTCLIIEDVVTSGISIEETIKLLEEEKLHVKDAVVFIDREQGGKQILGKHGYHLHSVFTLHQVLEVLEKNRKIDHETALKALAFIRDHQVVHHLT